MSETLKTKLRKIHALAQSGADGERENAQRSLDALLKKYELDLADIVDEAMTTVEFKWATRYEKRLLLQLLVTVKGTKENVRIWSYPGYPKSIGFDLTKAEAIEMEFLFNEYSPLWAEEVDALFGAFCFKHNLLAPADEDKEVTDEMLDQYLRQAQMAATLQNANLKRKRLSE
jgi:hypothetical protein